MIADGARWSEDLDKQLSEDVLATFATPAGARALAYLVKITRGRVLQPTASDAELRDLEGRRALVTIIDMRMEDARSRRRAAGSPPEPAAGGRPGPRRRRAASAGGPDPA